MVRQRSCFDQRIDSQNGSPTGLILSTRSALVAFDSHAIEGQVECSSSRNTRRKVETVSGFGFAPAMASRRAALIKVW